MKINQDASLITRLKQKETKAFEEVYLAYYSKLLGFSGKFGFRLLTPEDFVQETFIRLYNNAHLLKEEVLLDKQVFVICRNIILNQIKKEKKSGTFNSDDFILNIALEETDNSLRDADEALLRSLIEALPEKRKQVFILHKIEKLSYEEIVVRTGLSKKTIANHIYLAFSDISEKIKKSRNRLGTFYFPVVINIKEHILTCLKTKK